MIKLKHVIIRILETSRNHVLKMFNAKSVGVRAIIVDKLNRVLLVKHTYRPGWHTPGGGIKNFETPLQALKREIKEETNLDVTTEPILFGIYKNKWRGLSDYPILYIVKDFEGNAHCADEAEIMDIGWFEFSNLPKEITSNTYNRLDEFFSSKPKAENW